MSFEYINTFKVFFYDCAMIKLKLTDIFGASIEEDVLDHDGNIHFFRRYSNGCTRGEDFKWKRIENTRILGYLRVTHTVTSLGLSHHDDHTITRDADLSSYVDRAQIGFSPLMVYKEGDNVLAIIPNYSIREVIFDFDPDSITPDQIRQQ
jgi:hypothetical protein